MILVSVAGSVHFGRAESSQPKEVRLIILVITVATLLRFFSPCNLRQTCTSAINPETDPLAFIWSRPFAQTFILGKDPSSGAYYIAADDYRFL